MEDAIKAIADYAQANGIGFWQLVWALCIVVFVYRLPEILRVGAEFLNERKRIDSGVALKQEQSRKALERAKAKRDREREKAGQRQ